MTAPRPPARLITFPPAIDVETDRFLLARHGIAYRELPHSMPFLIYPSIRYGKIPVFLNGRVKCCGPRQLAEHLETQCPAEQKLVPTSDPERSEVEAAWKRYDDLGWATARLVYFFMVPNRKVTSRLFTRGTAWYERAANAIVYWPLVVFLRRTMPLNEGSADDSLAYIRKTFDAIDERLADGRRFLIADRFSLADLLFVVPAAPLVLEPGYGGAAPTFDEAPPRLQAIVNELRERPAAQFVARIYEQERRPPTDDR